MEEEFKETLGRKEEEFKETLDRKEEEIKERLDRKEEEIKERLAQQEEELKLRLAQDTGSRNSSSPVDEPVDEPVHEPVDEAVVDEAGVNEAETVGRNVQEDRKPTKRLRSWQDGFMPSKKKPSLNRKCTDSQTPMRCRISGCDKVYAVDKGLFAILPKISEGREYAGEVDVGIRWSSVDWRGVVDTEGNPRWKESPLTNIRKCIICHWNNTTNPGHTQETFPVCVMTRSEYKKYKNNKKDDDHDVDDDNDSN